MTVMDQLDHYEVLQISRNAESETVNRVFRILAARYHPDNPESGDAEHFLRLKKAYDVLGNFKARAIYDSHLEAEPEVPLAAFGSKDFLEGLEVEANRRIGVLCLLYRERRFNSEAPSLSALQLERLMNLPREHLMFTIWFLKEKKCISFTDNSEYTITGEGTEYIESHLPKQESLVKLLSAAQHYSRTGANPQRPSLVKAG
jgi:hypothetical protein